MGATITCSHAPGQATPITPEPRVKVSNQMIVTQSTMYSVAGCSLTSSGGPFCVTAQFTSAATRVKAQSGAVLLQDSQSTSPQTGSPLVVMVTQIRVKGQ